MAGTDNDGGEIPEIEKWDPELTERVVNILRPVLKRYFRSEMCGSDNIPALGGALLVSNHSGGQFSLDAPILAVEFYNKFGYDRPINTLAHDVLVSGRLANVMPSNRDHSGKPAERLGGAARGSRRRGIPWRRLRRVSTNEQSQSHRFQRAYGLCQNSP